MVLPGMPAGVCLLLSTDWGVTEGLGELPLFEPLGGALGVSPPPKRYPKELCPPPALTPRPILSDY